MNITPILLGISAVLFCTGIFIVLSRRNGVMALIGLELVLNACNLNFITFSNIHPEGGTGHMMAIFGMVIAAAELCVGLAIIVRIYRSFGTINLDEINSLKEN